MDKHSTLAFLLPILLVCAAILAVYSFLPSLDGGSIPSPAGDISLSLQGSPMVDGNTAVLRAVSGCGEIGVSLDGAEFGSGGPVLSQQFPLKEGSHSFFAQGKGCNATLHFTVLARECDGNGSALCERNGCQGARKCSGGLFSECALPKKVCIPGEKVGCSMNGCSFGYITCNPCGTGFGKCLPPGAAGDENESCTAKQ